MSLVAYCICQATILCAISGISRVLFRNSQESTDCVAFDSVSYLRVLFPFCK